ncbi:MGDG synthase family glycosyltransferase [Sulfobacillus harzensis]|uniref:Glycosyltransferase n=1 Tax=Sulfobacillus harzensis TaxID=2729629 RepID=A0A7Y0L0K5_9FIRM|nr:glycosyltransferase [Sulfobacillus harzensis]NMP21072.1 glycosyltransferase [Sulfobacillus harzensis]
MRILIASAGFGFGHHRAARALKIALEAQDPDVSVVIHDFLDVLPPRLTQALLGVHGRLARDFPAGYGAMYDFTGWLSRYGWWRRMEERSGLEAFRALLLETRPEVVVAVHPMPLMVLGALKRTGRWHNPVVEVMTDFVVHPSWVHYGIDRYCLPTEAARDAFRRRGVADRRLKVTGIPIDPAFANAAAPEEARQLLDWDARPRVLIMGTSQGFRKGMAAALMNHLGDLPKEVLTLIINADQALQRASQRLSIRNRVTLLPFQEQVALWMQAADVVVSKAGALTLSEVLALGRPLVIFRALPGQERGNARLVEREGAALAADTPMELRQAIDQILRDRALRQRMRTAQRRLARIEAAHAVATVTLTLSRRERR